MSQSNRRGSIRHRAKSSSKVFCVPGKYGLGLNIAVGLLDVSETGLRMVLKQALPMDSEVEVGLEACGERRPTVLPGQTVWCVPMVDGNYCAGVRFDKVLKYATLQALTYFLMNSGREEEPPPQRDQAKEGRERRLGSRRPPKTGSRVFCFGGSDGRNDLNIALKLLDVSESGIRLIVREPLQPSLEMAIGLEAAGDRRPTIVTGVVVWCTALMAGTHCVGVRLDQPLRDAAFQVLSRL